MKYVGQTGLSIKNRFREHFCKLKKAKQILHFSVSPFKHTGHSSSKVLIQPVGKIHMIQILHLNQKKY